ncbi:CHAP domain-containing protein [Actinomadura kijaniata]|uniref:CHAP domain-containing protein n=1 Tax=Actinomadura kijaniata TaxID=46161 RepID=UPI003F1CE790
MDPVGAKLLEIAKKELGYREKAGGYTKYGEWYGRTFEGGDDYYTTAPWCDMFLAWAADQAKVEDWAGQFAATIGHARWFQRNDAWGTEPEPGAVVFFAWSGSKDTDAIQHVGLVESVNGSTLHTIEANTDGVHLKRKARDFDSVVGYGYPGKVKVAGKSFPWLADTRTEKGYTPKHAAPAPRVLPGADRSGDMVAVGRPGREDDGTPLLQQETLLGGLLAVVLCGTVVLAVGKAAAARVPASAPIRVRKRGRHHRVPVTLPADIRPADLDAADAGTIVMPAVSAAVAAEAEDREFWSRVTPLQQDEDLAFWDSLHADLAPLRPGAPPLVTADEHGRE